MSDNNNKMGPNLQAGAGFLARRVQKSLNRAQEKVLQKLGKTMETKDEQFEICSQNLNKQQMDGSRLSKDVKAYYAAVKAVHETSKRLSQTLRDIYEPDWDGLEDLAVITDSEDLLWNDFEEKINDQLVRTMENYTSQFPEVKERTAKRGRKLVDYDSARHHLEALQSAKKKDDAKIAKAEEEFNKAQSVFEEINSELREELPVLYQSRIGCYVTVFQNISNLRDVFYKEMSVLNRDLYNVMKKLETQHSGKAFIVKGLNSATSKSKKTRSLVISNPIPSNTAIPADHVSILSQGQNGGAGQVSPNASENAREEEEEESGSSSKDVNSSNSDLSSSGANTPKRQSVSDNDSSSGIGRHSPTEEEEEESRAEPEETANQSEDDSAPKSEEVVVDQEEEPSPTDSVDSESLPQVDASEATQEEVKAKPAPVPAPRLSSFRRAERCPPEQQQQEEEVKLDEKQTEEEEEEISNSQHPPPGFLYKAVALESHTPGEDGMLQFEEGDVILVLSGSEEEGFLRGVREESWTQHKDLQSHSGMFSEKLIKHTEAE